MDERALLERARRGEEAAFGALYAQEALMPDPVPPLSPGLRARVLAQATARRRGAALTSWVLAACALAIPLIVGLVAWQGRPRRDDGQALEAIRRNALEGEAAFRRWNQDETDDAAYEEAVSKLRGAVGRLTELLYDPRGPYVDPNDPEYLRAEYEGYEMDLQRWGQLVHDLSKRRRLR
ncbi:MAG: hypothetical protein R3F62_06250 [Planctomycetota bacterium]